MLISRPGGAAAALRPGGAAAAAGYPEAGFASRVFYRV